MGRAKLMNLKNKTFILVLIELLNEPKSSYAVSKNIEKSQTTCFRAMRDLITLNYVKKDKNKYYIINKEKMIKEIDNILLESKDYLILKNKLLFKEV